jgi:sugar lactone lactonase YvrE
MLRYSLVVIVGLILLACQPVQPISEGTEPVIDYDAPFLPEGIAIDKDGNFYVSLANQSELRKVTPDGTESVLTTLPTGGFGLLGLAVDAPGNVYAALATADSETNGVYRVDSDGMSERLPDSEAILVPNAMVFDQEGNLYVTDTVLGAVWLIPPDGQAELWLQDALLEGTGSFEFGVPIGANGIAYQNETLYVANTEKGSIVSIPVNIDGTAGTPNVLVDELTGVDGLAFDVNDNIYAVRVIGNELIRINLADTTKSVLATADDGLDGPASLVFGTGEDNREYVFITNFALGNTEKPDPGVVKFNVGVPGLPLP